MGEQRAHELIAARLKGSNALLGMQQPLPAAASSEQQHSLEFVRQAQWADAADTMALVQRSAVHVLGAALKAYFGKAAGLRRGGVEVDGTVFFDGANGGRQRNTVRASNKASAVWYLRLPLCTAD